MYIVDHKRQIALIGEMKQLRKDTSKYEVYYHHPYTNQMWKSFFPRAEGDALGPKLLRHEPIPSEVEALLDQCLTEQEPSDAIGLGIEWSAHTSLWPDIISTLEQNYSNYLRGQLKLFLEHLNLSDQPKVDFSEPAEEDHLDSISDEQVDNLIWRSRKIRMKRFFVLG